MAPIGLKLCQNAFQTIPDISFFDAGHKLFFAFFANFEDPFTPRGWLRLAWNFGKTRFRWSPTFHFSTPEKKNRQKISSKKNCWPPPTLKIGKLPVLEELWIFGRQWQMRLENSLPELSVSAFYDPWRRGKKGSFCFWSDFWPKKTCTLFRRYSTIFHDIRRYIQKWGPTEHWRDPTEH